MCLDIWNMGLKLVHLLWFLQIVRMAKMPTATQKKVGK